MLILRDGNRERVLLWGRDLGRCCFFLEAVVLVDESVLVGSGSQNDIADDTHPPRFVRNIWVFHIVLIIQIEDLRRIVINPKLKHKTIPLFLLARHHIGQVVVPVYASVRLVHLKVCAVFKVHLLKFLRLEDVCQMGEVEDALFHKLQVCEHTSSKPRILELDENLRLLGKAADLVHFLDLELVAERDRDEHVDDLAETGL